VPFAVAAAFVRACLPSTFCKNNSAAFPAVQRATTGSGAVRAAGLFVKLVEDVLPAALKNLWLLLQTPWKALTLSIQNAL